MPSAPSLASALTDLTKYGAEPWGRRAASRSGEPHRRSHRGERRPARRAGRPGGIMTGSRERRERRPW